MSKMHRGTRFPASNRVNPAGMTQRLGLLVSALISLAVSSTGCCDGIDAHSFTFSCQGDCEEGLTNVEVELVVGADSYICTQDGCNSDRATSTWTLGLPQTVFIDSDSGDDVIEVELRRDGQAFYAAAIEVQAEAQHCNCNENVGNLDRDCRDARFSHMLRRGAVSYAYPAP